MSAEQFLENRLAEHDMRDVAGLAGVNRRLARLGVEDVDLTVCDHGQGATCRVSLGRVMHRVSVHGARDVRLALEQLCDEIETLRRTRGK